MPLPFCIYILFSEKDHQLYIGFTTNLEKRIQTHSEGGTKSTAFRRPLKLIYCEFYLLENEARNRERYFKTTAGKKAIKFMLQETLLTLNYRPRSHKEQWFVYDELSAELQ